MKRRNFGRYSGGFTLIELMIVVAIIGIIAAIAYPSYQESVSKSRRADAKGALQELAQFMERVYVENKTYNPAGLALPFTEAPKEGGTKFYNLSVAAAANTYTLTATPKNAQAGDKCGNFTLTNDGTKNVTGAAGRDYCW